MSQVHYIYVFHILNDEIVGTSSGNGQLVSYTQIDMSVVSLFQM